MRLPVQDAGSDIEVATYFANLTLPLTAFDASKKPVTVTTGGLPPPIPPRPAPKPPSQILLSLFASASDDVWEKAKCKGANFVRAMRGTDAQAGSVFNPPRQFAAAEFEELGTMSDFTPR